MHRLAAVYAGHTNGRVILALSLVAIVTPLEFEARR